MATGRTPSRPLVCALLLASLGACDPFGDLKSSLELVDPTKTRFKAPGRKLVSGSFDEFSVILKDDGALAVLALNRGKTRQRAHIASFSAEASTSTGCDTGEFSRILGDIPYRGFLAVFDDANDDSTGNVLFLNEDCKAVQTLEEVALVSPTAGVVLPIWLSVFREPDGRLKVLTSDQFETLPDSNDGEIVGASSNFLWIKTPRALMRFSLDDLQRDFFLEEETSETQADDSSPDLVFRRKSGEFFYVTPKGEKVSLGSTLCNPIPSGGQILSFDPCVSKTLRYDRIVENDDGSIETHSHAGKAIEGRLAERGISDGSAFLLLSKESEGDDYGHVYRVWPRDDGSLDVDEMTARGLLTTNSSIFLANVENGVGELRSSPSTLLAKRALPMLDASGLCALVVRANFDGSHGDGLCFPGGKDYGTPRVFGRKIPNDARGTWVSFGINDEILFVSDENESGELHRLTKGNDGEVADEVLDLGVRVASTEPISSPAGVVYLKGRGDSNDLVVSLDYSGLTQTIHDRVSHFFATAHSDSLAQGIFYLVQDGEDAGIWYAKAE